MSSLALVLVLAACGGDDDTSTASEGGGGPSVEIVEPTGGAEISVPFTLVVDSSEELGPTDTGNHHVHVYFDGDDSSYEVIESGNGEEHEITVDSPAMEGVEPGEHTLNVSLRNADHSAAGAEAEVTVTVGEEGSGGSPSDDEDDESEEPPDYDY
ncbi:hypothetical protein E1262_24400 [Jiangella aurantiaca]|uniref:DUF4399 domain-containing protein n=1 Tax=Jiangella aurantiaca TaxID=2530373 RepID=A0A4R5A2L4_9ACTN|nr:hypothetical protein [Jiangella aurantiaca]TDD65695.1 hypothetical protein E1262_24400 [Jiangella aurantiaca]